MIRKSRLVLISAVICLLACESIAYGATPIMAAQDATGKWGFVNAEGKYIISPAYEIAYPFHEFHALVRLKKKWGVIDTLGNLVVTPIYDDAQGIVNEGMITVKKQGKWGVVDLSNRVVLSFEHSYLSIFNEGFIVAGKPGKSKATGVFVDVAILDISGKVRLDYGSYQLPGFLNGTIWSLGRWPLVRDGWISLLYTHQFDLDVVNKPDETNNYIIAHHVGSGLPLAEPLVVVNKNTVVTVLPYFSNGVLMVKQLAERDALSTQEWWAEDVYNLDDRVQYEGMLFKSLRDHNVNNIPSLEIGWQRIEIVSGSVFTLYRNDPRKNYIVYQPYEGRNWMYGVDYFPGDLVTRYDNVYEALETHISTSDNGPEGRLWRYKDSRFWTDTLAMRQNLSCPATELGAEFVGTFYNGYALMKTSTGVKVLGENGWVYDTHLDAEKFDITDAIMTEGLVNVRNKNSNKWGYVNMKAKEITGFEYDKAGPFINGVAIVSVKGKYGAIDKNGKWLIQPIFNALEANLTVDQQF